VKGSALKKISLTAFSSFEFSIEIPDDILEVQEECVRVKLS